jgi:hypothetical protein
MAEAKTDEARRQIRRDFEARSHDVLKAPPEKDQQRQALTDAELEKEYQLKFNKQFPGDSTESAKYYRGRDLYFTQQRAKGR